MIFKPNHYPIINLSSIWTESLIDEAKVNSASNTNARNFLKEKIDRFSDTHTHVIIVPEKNIVYPEFFQQEINLVDTIDLNNMILSFSAKNSVNGNTYGNNGIVCYPTKTNIDITILDHILDPNTFSANENTCLRFSKCVSDFIPTESPKSAWKNGFIEATKLCLIDGVPTKQLSKLFWKNYERLWRCMHLGSDVDNGLWYILGARQATYIIMSEQKFDTSLIYDNNKLDEIFDSEFSKLQLQLEQEANRLGNDIKKITGDFRIKNIYSSKDSILYKTSCGSPTRSPEEFIKYKFLGNYDVICFGDNITDEVKSLLENKSKQVKYLHNYENDKTLLVDAAKLSSTEYFWLVDSKSILEENFEFEYRVPFYDSPKNRIWKSKNLSNGQIEDNGVMLISKFFALHLDFSSSNPILGTGIEKEIIMKISNLYQ